MKYESEYEEVWKKYEIWISHLDEIWKLVFGWARIYVIFILEYYFNFEVLVCENFKWKIKLLAMAELKYVSFLYLFLLKTSL